MEREPLTIPVSPSDSSQPLTFKEPQSEAEDKSSILLSELNVKDGQNPEEDKSLKSYTAVVNLQELVPIYGRIKVKLTHATSDACDNI